ncbi:MAG: ABC transporter permease [Lachnospiraceae bacterium]|nr:ABC transporter permease [Lachnospiraceae bacterium]
MTTLLVLRERIKTFYARFGGYMIRVLRFVLALAVFLTINRTIGYMERMSRDWMAVVAAVICACLPGSFTVVLAVVFVLIEMYAVSLEVLFVTAAVFVLFFCLYFVFQPGDSLLLVLMPLLFLCRIPLVIPLIMGLVGTAFSVIPVSFGIIVYYMLKYVRENVGVLASNGSLSMPGRYTQMINGILENREMWVMAAACCLTLLVVYLIRRLSVSHAWEIAIGVGTVTNVLLLFAGVFVADVSFPVSSLIVEALVAAACGLILEFFVFHLDYSRTERVQFEDDDYYYYVKAVPKVVVTQPEVTVTKINAKTSYNKGVEKELFQLRQELSNTAELFTAGKDLERTRVLFEKETGKKTNKMTENGEGQDGNRNKSV